MRIFILEQQASIEIDQNIFDCLIDWMPFLSDLIQPIVDKKKQLVVDSTYMIDTLDQYIEFQKYYMAGQMILGAMLTIVERVYKVNHKNSELSKLPSEELLRSDEMKDFLVSGGFDQSINRDMSIKPISAVENATQELLEMGSRFSKTILNEGLYKNLESILIGSNAVLKTTMKLEAFIQNLNDTFIKLKIESTKADVLIYFNGGENQFALLDKWLDAEELTLPKAEDSSWLISSPENFLDWYNNLKLRLENECSFQTLMSYVSMFDSDTEKYKENIKGEIKKICESANLSDHEKRKQVVGFCNGILNKRKDVEQKSYQDLSMEQLLESFNPDKNQYLLNIYA